jgi:hypothetical protein
MGDPVAAAHLTALAEVEEQVDLQAPLSLITALDLVP